MLIKFAIQDFLDERKLMNASEYTLINYRSFFKGFQSWLRENGVHDVSDITTNTLRLYLTYCKNEKGNSSNTINNKVKNLKAFFNHLIENEYVQHNPCLKLKKLQTDERIEVFTDVHIRQMLRYYRRMKRKDHGNRTYGSSASHFLWSMAPGTNVGLKRRMLLEALKRTILLKCIFLEWRSQKWLIGKRTMMSANVIV